MNQNSEIESIKPALSVVLDDGDFIINSTGPVGKAMAQAVLPLLASAHRVTIISDGDMKVLKRNPAAENGTVSNIKERFQTASREFVGNLSSSTSATASVASAEPTSPDIQDQFISDLAAGRTGEAATGESPSPTPGPSDPVPVPSGKPAADQPAARRVPRIYQDAAAPPAPELAEQEMANLLAEAAAAEQESARAAEDRRFQSQQAVQASQPQTDPATEGDPSAAAAAKPRARRERNLATSGRPCGRCGGGGQIQGDAGFVGACPVCHGDGMIKTWDRSLKVR